MRCEEIMKRDVERVLESDTCALAAAKMRDRNVGLLPVCDLSGKVLGTLTDRDLSVRLVAAGLGADTPVSQVMTRNVVWCAPEDDVKRARQLMMEHHVSRVLVCDPRGVLLGIISLSDLAQLLQEEAGETLRRVSEREAQHP